MQVLGVYYFFFEHKLKGKAALELIGSIERFSCKEREAASILRVDGVINTSEF